MSEMRNKIFDLNLPNGGHRCRVSYCYGAGLPQRIDRQFNDFRILYLLEGRGRYSDADHDGIDLCPGTFLLRPPSHHHVIERFDEEPWKEYALVLPQGLYRQLLELGVIPKSPLLYHWQVTEQVRARLQALFDRAGGLIIDQSGRFLHEIQGVLLAGTATQVTSVAVRHVPEPISHAMEILASDLSSSMTMPAVAQRVAMGYHAFRKTFVRHLGLSPKEYRIHRMIEKAQDLLLNPELRMADVAYQLGYPDPHSFSKQFKRVTGLSPSAFRES